MNEQLKDKYTEILEREITRNAPEEVRKELVDLKIEMLRSEMMDAQARLDSAKLSNEWLNSYAPMPATHFDYSFRMAKKAKKIRQERKPLLCSIVDWILNKITE